MKCEKCDKEFSSKEALIMHNKAKHATVSAEPKFSKKQKKNIKVVAIITILILAVTGFSYVRSLSFRDAPVLEVVPSAYNFGTVSQAEGTATTTMTLKNNGVSNLIINNIDTSCGCTSASVIYNDKEGPKFGMSMHGTNPKNWQQVIAPGETTELKIYYNPNVHKEMRGAFSRTVMLYTNDPRHKIQQIKISGVQGD